MQYWHRMLACQGCPRMMWPPRVHGHAQAGYMIPYPEGGYCMWSCMKALTLLPGVWWYAGSEGWGAAAVEAAAWWKVGAEVVGRFQPAHQAAAAVPWTPW